ncbi:putative repeat protein (TIGR01451 family) [Pseudacidovorax intermedius]|uniref:Putative repeat protein (TIGR01451 family) n=1 Tax=Pseudacidovorax intermedius TaxID=433924 RepID=A0A370FGH6_9BURK|nr:hypothetical protein [Pseudacidovorax intermedius]RDI25850.1 putative repeat protein (TIGR01451 family) [Pseudacidovorax intermedius]
MKNQYPLTRGSGKLLATWAGTAAMAAVFLSGSPAAMAAAPAAGTSIGNVASASYLDPNGTSQVSTSNLVQTTVLQVGSYALDGKITTASTLDVVNNKTGAAGATIYAAHVLTNTGNGADGFNIKVDASASKKFAKIEIYNDSNFDGLPDSATPLCSDATGQTGCSLTSVTTVAGNNGQYGFVVAYSIPTTATGTGAYDVGNVTVTPQASSVTSYGYAASNQSVQVQDSVTLTNAAAFNVSKALALPNTGIGAPGGGSWPAAIAAGKRTPAGATCATTWAGMGSNPASCVYTTYTITYSNTGGAVGRFNLQDVIGTGATAGFTYVSGSAVWSSNPGVALSETAGSNGANIDFAASGGTLTFVDNSLPVNNTRSLTFVVLVNSSATVGTASTTNTVKYNPTDAPTATASAPALGSTPSTSNGSPFTVQGTYSVAVGAATSVASSDAKDSTAGTPNNSSTDAQSNAKVAAGSATSFTHVVYNLGNDTDSVNISIATQTFPANTIFRFYKSDGTTELSDTNNDGKVDTGPIAIGGSVKVIVKATIPPTTAINTGANYTLTLLGTSGSDSGQFDASKDTVVAVTGPAVDLTNSAAGVFASGSKADVGTGPSAQPTVTQDPVPAGSWTTFDLWVTNNDSNANTYTLSASSTSGFPGSLPAGWTVKFVSGATTSASCAAGTAITTTGTAAANGGQTQVTACIFVPATQVQISQAVYFQVRAVSAASDGSTPVDTLYDQVNVTAAASTYSATIGVAGTGQVAPGGSIVYAHTLSATGTGACKPGKLTVTLGSGNAALGWTYAAYVDSNGNGVIDASDQLIDATGAIPAPVPGTDVKLLIKLFAPGGATVGSADISTVAVTFPAGSDNCGTPSTTDTTTVVAAQVRLYKTQAKNPNATCDAAGITTALGNLATTALTAKPGECIVYQVKAINEGTSTVTNLNISDVLPAYTTLTTVQPTSTCASSAGTVLPAFTNPTGWSASTTSVSCGNGTTATTVAPGASATLTFQVQLQQ